MEGGEAQYNKSHVATQDMREDKLYWDIGTYANKSVAQMTNFDHMVVEIFKSVVSSEGLVFSTHHKQDLAKFAIESANCLMREIVRKQKGL